MKKKRFIVFLCCLTGCMLIIGCGKQNKELNGKLNDRIESAEQDISSEKEDKVSPDDEKKPERKISDVGKAPALLYHRGSEFEHNSNGQLTIDHHYSFISLDEKDARSYKGLNESLGSARDDIIADEKAKREKEEKTLKENELFSYEENWDTYVRRADGSILSFVTEYVAVGEFDGQYYTEYKSHNFYTENGKEIEFRDVIADEDAFFDLLAEKLEQYYEYVKKNIYYMDFDTDKEQIKEDVRYYMKEGSCAWTIDPQGVSVFLNSYTGLQDAVSAVVLFSEDNEGKIFNKEFLESAKDEWIMQVPQYVNSYCDMDDNGKAEFVRAYMTEEMSENEGSEEYWVSGFNISYEGKHKGFSTRMLGGTTRYDIFLMHKDHKTCFFEAHDEYNTAFINTYAIDKDEIYEADSIRGMLEGSDEDYDYDREYLIPCYIPTEMSRIRVLIEEDNEARDLTDDIISVDSDGKIEIRYGEYEHVSLGVNEAADERNQSIGENIEPFFGLWIGSFKDRNEAEELVSKLKDAGLTASYVYSPEWENLNREPYYCVTIGKSGSEPEAQEYLDDANKLGYKDAYIKYTGNRLSHRIDYYIFDEGSIDIRPDEVVLNNVQIEDLSGGTTGEATLIADKDTVFDTSCDMQFFGNYRNGDSVLKWFNYNKELMDKDINKYMEKGPALKGVFEVSITGNHIDRFYGCYWWD